MFFTGINCSCFDPACCKADRGGLLIDVTFLLDKELQWIAAWQRALNAIRLMHQLDMPAAQKLIAHFSAS